MKQELERRASSELVRREQCQKSVQQPQRPRVSSRKPTGWELGIGWWVVIAVVLLYLVHRGAELCPY